MNDDLISRSALRAKYQAILDRGDMFCEYDIIGMLDNAPPVEPQKIVTIPSELIEKLAKCVVDTIGNIDWDKAIEAYKARPQGEWIGGEIGHCSICGSKGCASDIWNGCKDGMYCPNCGADMRAKEAEKIDV